MSTKAVTPDSNPAFEQPDLEVPSGDAYDKWRMTGELPSSDAEMEEVEKNQREEEEKAQGPKKAEGAASSEEEKSVTRAGSEPASKPQTGIKRDENSRIKQLTESLKREREEKQKLLDKLTAAAPVSAEKGEKAEESSTRKADASKATAEPDISDKNEKGEAKYKTWGEYQKAHDKWVFEEAERRADAKWNQRSEEMKTTAAKEAEAARIRETFQPRVREARKKYSDFDAVAFNKDIPIVEGSFVERYILESENGPEIAYYLGQHPEEVFKLTGLSQERNEKGQFLRVAHEMHPAQAARYLAMLELSLGEDEGEGGGEIPPKKPSAKPVTKAPPPPKQVSGKPPQTMSEEAAALEDDDFEGYRTAANRREIARRKGK